ncbi:MAG: hypothetical protein AVDCRST_MAG50-1265 [uncultured Acidimicrobiales bacterium]|uniref:EfeO-type cupredoxin-like domain-containing protein n=1 Tax=uncultured Acidimicrobiales bacterium TaxID=310071 RepID=A0A6J4HSM6_9ACTN|nr:MAG: hypothetical protein AVDCRST_MAG50-1265 [uncultured Acidimicrobiales bacterium]
MARLPAPVLGLVLVLAMGACSKDDGASVRDARAEDGSVNVIGGESEGGGSVSAVAAGCVTRGATTRLPTSRLEVSLDDTAITVPASVTAGVNQVLVKNIGTSDHELWIVAAASPADLPVANGRVVTDGLTPIVRMEAFGRNKLCQNSFVIPPGRYVAFCNLAPPGATPHFEAGMVASFEAV